jgi:hypothetical protein
MIRTLLLGRIGWTDSHQGLMVAAVCVLILLASAA